MHWYFDFISPFAFLQSTRLPEFVQHESVQCVPVLFAGLLQHWGNLGPAEIQPKRTWTFQHVVWLAHRDNISLTLPEHHPFNPLPLLRLSIALGNEIDVVQRLFKFVWQDGHVPQNEQAFAQLLDEMNCTADALSKDNIKNTLIQNGSTAIENGVFGVPSILRADQLFWGYDATDMAHAHRDGHSAEPDNRGLWPAEKIASVKHFPEGISRPRNK